MIGELLLWIYYEVLQAPDLVQATLDWYEFTSLFGEM